MNKDRLTRDGAMEMLKKLEDQAPPPSDDGICPWDYRQRVVEAAKKTLHERNLTRGITIAAKKDEALVSIVQGKAGEGFRRQNINCQVAWEDGLDPEMVGRQAVLEFEENLERSKRGE